MATSIYDTLSSSADTLSERFRYTSDLKLFLTREGYEVLGYGAEAVVVKEADRAIKIMPGGSKGFMHYIEVVVPRLRSKHCPKVLSTKNINDAIIVEMELLLSKNDLIDSGFSYDWKMWPSYDQVIEAVKEEAQREKRWTDLHDENIMFREKDLCPVIVDPYYW